MYYRFKQRNRLHFYQLQHKNVLLLLFSIKIMMQPLNTYKVVTNVYIITNMLYFLPHTI